MLEWVSDSTVTNISHSQGGGGRGGFNNYGGDSGKLIMAITDKMVMFSSQQIGSRTQFSFKDFPMT